jgi:hypothetical protein
MEIAYHPCVASYLEAWVSKSEAYGFALELGRWVEDETWQRSIVASSIVWSGNLGVVVDSYSGLASSGIRDFALPFAGTGPLCWLIREYLALQGSSGCEVRFRTCSAWQRVEELGEEVTYGLVGRFVAAAGEVRFPEVLSRANCCYSCRWSDIAESP